VGAGVLVAILITFAQPRLYQSEASLEIQGINENFLNTRDVYPTAASSPDSSGTYVQTLADILQQDALIEQVVKTLHVEGRPDFQSRPRFWARTREFSVPGAAPAQLLRNATEIVKKNVKIVPSRASRVIRIVSDARDPQFAADVANTLAQTFIQQTIELRQRTAQQTYESLSLQRSEVRNRLLKSEAQLADSGCTAPALLGVASIRTSKLPECDALKRELESDRRFFETISQRVNETRLASSVPQSNVRLVSPARPATHPYKPNLPLNIAIAMFGGLTLAVSVAMLREQTNTFLRLPGEAGMYLTLPELGAIPQAGDPRPSARRLLGFADVEPQVQHLVIGQFSSLSEPFRATLASILSTNRDGDHPHSLVVTSSQPMEGKTTVASNLGIGLAEIGNKVLLIDGDMRRPRLHKVFEADNSWGLSDVLREKNAIEDLPLDALVKRTAVPHLYLLPSGACIDNIFSLLLSGRLARLLPRFRQEFDYVLVDAPPCLEFADARIMARYADQVLLVVRANYTDRRIAQAAVQRLFLDGIQVMGVILNRCDSSFGSLYPYAMNGSVGRVSNECKSKCSAVRAACRDAQMSCAD
jgi:receptor protein-tyrosine kinase